MVPIKVECECGQNYAFDVEPVNGRMPSAIACPSCGADGTAAANEYISQQLAPPIAVASNPAPIRLAKVELPPAVMPGAPDPGRAKLEREAKAKMMGGDSTEAVAAFLRVKGFDATEAMELAKSFYQERAAIVRSNGVKKTIVGFALMLVPVIAYFIFKAMGFFLIRRMIWTYIVGIVGGYMFVSGIIMILAPKSEKGTVVKE